MKRRYADVSDLIAHGKSLTAAESEAAEILLDEASAQLRITAKKYGKNLDEMIMCDSDYGATVKSIVIQAVSRAFNSMADSSPAIAQGSQSALGYSVSMTYLTPGQSLYFLRNELKELGILRQTFGALEVY